MAKRMAGSSFVIDATDQYYIGGPNGQTGVVVIQLDVTGVTSIVVKARHRKIGAVDVTTPAPVAVPFKVLHLNGAVSAFAAGSNVAITGDSLIIVEAHDLDVVLDAAWTSGSTAVHWSFCPGAI